MAVATSLGAVAGSYLAVRTGAADRLDGPARRLLTRRHGPVPDRLLGTFTDLGSTYALAGVATSLAATGRRALAMDVAVAGAGAWVAAQSTKPLLHRPRPYQLETSERVVAVPAGSSWPSGHAALAAAMADSIWHGAGHGTRAALVLTTGAIGLSRCYVGVHHLTDIVAGVGVGVLTSRVSRRLRGRGRAA